MTLRIAHIIDSLQWGGAQKLELTFAAALRAHDAALTVISLQADGTTPVVDELRALGAQVVSVPSRRALHPWRVWQVAQMLRRSRFDIVHTHLMSANVVGTLASRIAGVPVVASLHSVRSEPKNTRSIRHHLETMALRYGTARVIAVGHMVAEAHQHRLAGRPIAVVPNAVSAIAPLSDDQRTALRSELVGDPTRPLLISVGRLVPQKGYADLLRAFAAVRAQHPTAALVIAGDGPMRDDLAALVRELGLSGHAVLLGMRNDVPRLLGASDIFVSSSHWEGLPVAMLEAMSAGLPIVATRVGEVPRVVVEGTGLLVPAHDAPAMTVVLRALLDNPAAMRAMGARGQAHVARTYNADVWADRLLAIYAQVAARPAYVLQE